MPSETDFGQQYFEGTQSNYGLAGGYERYDSDIYWQRTIDLIRAYAPKGLPKYRMLDLGAAYGFLTKRLSRAFSDVQTEIEVVGADISRFALKKAQNQPDMHADLLRVDLNDGQRGGLPFQSGSFQVVTAYDVLEHANGRDDDRWNLGDINRLLTSEGVLVVQVPVMDTWAGKILNSKLFDHDVSHVNKPNVKDFLISLEQHGFKVQETHMFWNPIGVIKIPGIPVAMEIIAQKIQPDDAEAK